MSKKERNIYFIVSVAQFFAFFIFFNTASYGETITTTETSVTLISRRSIAESCADISNFVYNIGDVTKAMPDYDGFRPVLTTGFQTKDGFAVMVFKRNKQIIIAFRGTNPNSAKVFFDNIAADYSFVRKREGKRQDNINNERREFEWRDVKFFTHTLQEYYTYTIKNISSKFSLSDKLENINNKIKKIIEAHKNINEEQVTVATSTLRQYIEMSARVLISVNKKYPSPEYQIILTGHSLGGGIAQMLSWETGLIAVTFNAPGVGELTEDIHNILRPLNAISFGYGKHNPKAIESIVTQGDVISRYGTNIGIVWTLPQQADAISTKNPYKWWQNHKMDTIVELMRNPDLEYYPGVVPFGVEAPSIQREGFYHIKNELSKYDMPDY